MLITENELTVNSSIVDHLRLQLVQSMAMIRLMISKQWFEPADVQQMHYSTLLHQILAITAQWGGVRYTISSGHNYARQGHLEM